MVVPGSSVGTPFSSPLIFTLKLCGEGPLFLMLKVTIPALTVDLSSAIMKSFSWTITTLPPLEADVAGVVVAAVGALVTGAAVGAVVATKALDAARVETTVGTEALAALTVGAMVGDAETGLVGAMVAVVLAFPPHAARRPSTSRATSGSRRFRMMFPFIGIIRIESIRGS